MTKAISDFRNGLCRSKRRPFVREKVVSKFVAPAPKAILNLSQLPNVVYFVAATFEPTNTTEWVIECSYPVLSCIIHKIPLLLLILPPQTIPIYVAIINA